MEKFVSVFLKRLSSLLFVFLCGSAIAGQWQPLCIEGSSCEFPYKEDLVGEVISPLFEYDPIDRFAVGPLVTEEGIFLHHSPLHLDDLDRHVFQLSATGLEDFGDRLGFVSDLNAIQVPGGRTFSFWLGGGLAWFFPSEDIETIVWHGGGIIFGVAMIGPPVIVNNRINIGHVGYAASFVGPIADEGISPSVPQFVVDGDRFNGDRFNLLENPEKNALWAIESEYRTSLKGLWEWLDDGVIWTQIDDGSFPSNTVRVVHDPDNSMVSYALTSHGLFVSVNRGVSWQATSMVEPVHGMVFVERMPGLSRALIVGTDTGVSVSVDEAASWVSMGHGLPEIPHTVTYGHGQLIATSDAGYFTCNAIDCGGLATPVEIGVTEIEATHDFFRNLVKISWEPVDYASSYRVFRCLDDDVKSCGSPIGFLLEREQSRGFYDDKATPGIIYHYRVRACIKNRCGDFSAPDTGFRRLATPADIDASDGTFDEYVRISWKPVDGATIYRVFRCPDAEISSCGLPISYPRETFFNDTKAVSGTIYHFRVRACTKDICSEFSAADRGFIE